MRTQQAAIGQKQRPHRDTILVPNPQTIRRILAWRMMLTFFFLHMAGWIKRGSQSRSSDSKPAVPPRAKAGDRGRDHPNSSTTAYRAVSYPGKCEAAESGGFGRSLEKSLTIMYIIWNKDQLLVRLSSPRWDTGQTPHLSPVFVICHVIGQWMAGAYSRPVPSFESISDRLLYSIRASNFFLLHGRFSLPSVLIVQKLYD